VNATAEVLKRQFAALLAWERRKRWEQSCLMSAGAAFTFALVLLPLHSWWAPLLRWRWLMPMIGSMALAPYFFYHWRWQRGDSTRALVQLDKTLGLAERATTAWELAEHAQHNAASELVFKQTLDRLRTLNPRAVSPRRWGWSVYAVAPLGALWFALLWFDVDRSMVAPIQSSAAQSLAHKLREYARELQDKAKSDSLRESLKAGQTLENKAQQAIDAKTPDEQFKKELAGVAKTLAPGEKSGAGKDFSGAESQQSLRDLKAELDAARDLFNFPNGAKGQQELPSSWLDRLASLPQIKRQFDREQPGSAGLGQNELKAFLDRLERQATGELDRRALLDAQQFLEQMMQSQGRKDQSNMQAAGRGDQESPGDGSREKNASNLPGKEPGEKTAGFNSLPEFRGAAQTQINGSIGAGESSGVMLKAAPKPGKSELEQQEIVANYRRQAEQELNSERVPEALKETIRNYFLSLEKSEPKK
jgi:hypothetical protein